jgi:hypothetical protein
MHAVRTGLITAATLAAIASGLVAPSLAQATPLIGACYGYKAATLKEVSSSAPAVDCTATHTAETFYVGTAPDALGLPSSASKPAILAASAPCTTKAMNAYIGMPTRALPSRFRTVVLFPTDQQWAAGERWMRCDVVLQGGLALKEFAGPVTALVAGSPQTQFDFCTPGSPDAKATEAYPCLSPKTNWIKVLDQELGGPGSKFPGISNVEKRTRALCKAQGRAWGGKQKYPGWWAIWPTSIGWTQGARAAQCFVPYKQYLEELTKRNTPAPAPSPAATPTPTPSASS